MAKQGMKRPEISKDNRGNSSQIVPQLQGRAKLSNEKASPIIAGTFGASQKVYHSKPHAKSEKLISKAYSEIDTDTARATPHKAISVQRTD